jgi:hypothetical protein
LNAVVREGLSGSCCAASRKLESPPRIIRTDQNDLVPAVLESQVLAKELFITGFYAESDSINQNQPPLRVVVSVWRDLTCLFFDAKAQVLLRFLKNPASGVIVCRATRHEELRIGISSATQLDLEAVADGRMSQVGRPVSIQCRA